MLGVAGALRLGEAIDSPTRSPSDSVGRCRADADDERDFSDDLSTSPDFFRMSGMLAMDDIMLADGGEVELVLTLMIGGAVRSGGV